MRKFGLLLAGVSLLALSAVPGTASAAKPGGGGGGTNQTGQGIMVNLNAAGTFAIVDTQTWHYNTATAAGYFSNAWDGAAPTVTCSGPGCATAPAAPAAPAPDASQVTGPQQSSAVQVNQCTFLDGGTLVGHNYTQTAKVSTGSGKTSATYTYTYTYNVTPTTNPVATFTAWDFVGSSGPTTAHIAIPAAIAGESVLVSAKYPSPGKFSYSLSDSTDGNRVQNLVITVYDLNNANAVIASSSATSSIQVNGQGDPSLNGGLGGPEPTGTPYSVDYAYTTNAGSNGTTSILRNGDARTILDTDVFTGNNDGGADGSALAIANMDAVAVDLPPGSYKIELTGTVKGNSVVGADISFDVNQTIHIITQSQCVAP